MTSSCIGVLLSFDMFISFDNPQKNIELNIQNNVERNITFDTNGIHEHSIAYCSIIPDDK